MFPGVILLVPIYKIIVDLGLLDTKASLVLAYTTFALPFCVWMLKGYFDTIPISLEEAGRIDGLTPFGTFWRIVMPLSLPGIAVTAFYMFITAWNEVAVRQRLPDRDRELHAAHRPADLRLPVRAAVRLADGRCGHRDDSRRDRVPVRPALPGERPDARRGERVITR